MWKATSTALGHCIASDGTSRLTFPAGAETAEAIRPRSRAVRPTTVRAALWERPPDVEIAEQVRAIIADALTLDEIRRRE